MVSREIKFRAWNYLTEKMVSPAHPNFEPDGDIEVDGYYVKYDGDERAITLMQYTGLKDKNGVEIYEGDVVTIGNGLKRVVIWDAPGFWLAKKVTDKIDVDSFSTPGAYEEVIGNIYETPGLLK